jgi:hypothetical protein
MSGSDTIQTRRKVDETVGWMPSVEAMLKVATCQRRLCNNLATSWDKLGSAPPVKIRSVNTRVSRVELFSTRCLECHGRSVARSF